MNWSVSLDAIQVKRGESSSAFLIFPAWTKCQRSSPSAVPHPTHEPVEPWSLIFHHVARRSLLGGIVGAAATAADFSACSNAKSASTFSDGMQLRIRLGPRAPARRLVVRRFGAGMAIPPGPGRWGTQRPIGEDGGAARA